MTEMFFVVSGGFALYNPNFNDPRWPLPAFCVIPYGRTYGDYQILFDLYPNFDFRTYKHDFRHTSVNYVLEKHLKEATDYVLMCLSSQVLNHLCELFPLTA